jgi:hypothetical protein
MRQWLECDPAAGIWSGLAIETLSVRLTYFFTVSEPPRDDGSKYGNARVIAVLSEPAIDAAGSK